jgi:DNA-binding protein HU-beta
VVTVGEQQKRQVILLCELSVRCRRVVGNAEHFDPELLEIFPAVTQPGGLEPSTGGGGLGIKEQQVGPASEVTTRNPGVVVGQEFEIDEWFSSEDHLSRSSDISDHFRPHQQRQCHEPRNGCISGHGTRAWADVARGLGNRIFLTGPVRRVSVEEYFAIRGGVMAGKAELVDRVAELTGYPKTQVAMTFDLLFELISEALAENDKVTVPNFGTFQISERPARIGRNPATGEAITIAASRSVRFKVSKNLKGML